MLSLVSFVQEHARVHPERVAVSSGEQVTTYGQLEAASSAVARYLTAQGLQPGDHVALSCPNLPYFPIIYYGILKAGMVVVPLSILFKAHEIAYHLNDSDAKAYFLFEGSEALPMGQAGTAAFAEATACEHLVIIPTNPNAASRAASPIENGSSFTELLREYGGPFEPVLREADDTAVVLYTSGTTGKPKGAELTQLNMVMNAIVSSNIVRAPGLEAHEQVVLTVLPLFHIFGQTCVMNAMFYLGGQLVLQPRFEAESALELMKRHSVNIFVGVPTMYWGLLGALQTGSAEGLNLRTCVSGGSPMPVELLRRFEEAFGVDILEGYGLSETSPVACFNQQGRPRKVGSVGQAVLGMELRVVDTEENEVAVGEAGEIVIRGHSVMKGYYKRPEDTATAMRGGWFHTGDVGIRDADDYFSIVDRIKDLIIRGGYNVYPRDVEEALIKHPEVSLAAVVGVPDDAYGEEIKAFVVLQAGSSLTPEALRDWSKEQLAAYKYPREITFVESLPLTASGKILRRELRDRETQGEPSTKVQTSTLA